MNRLPLAVPGAVCPGWLADFWQHMSAPEDEVEPANNKKESA